MTVTSAKLVHVVQGEHAISDRSDSVITTVLGSCVSACLYDPERGIGGMNHFLLPNAGPTKSDIRYAAAAMEVLVNGLMRRGAVRTRLRAKLFGGAHLLVGLPDIGQLNAQAASRFLENEGIRLVKGDLGGRLARRIHFWPVTGRVQLRFLGETQAPRRETATLPKSGEIELFYGEP